MINKHIARSIVAFFSLFAASLLFAHHAGAGADRSKVVTMTGVVSKVEWQNPHIQIFIDVKNDQGKTENWALSWSAVSNAARTGVTKETLKPGEQITVQTFLHRPSEARLSAEAGCVTIDGRQVGGGHGPPCAAAAVTQK